MAIVKDRRKRRQAGRFGLWCSIISLTLLVYYRRSLRYHRQKSTLADSLEGANSLLKLGGKQGWEDVGDIHGTTSERKLTSARTGQAIAKLADEISGSELVNAKEGKKGRKTSLIKPEEVAKANKEIGNNVIKAQQEQEGVDKIREKDVEVSGREIEKIARAAGDSLRYKDQVKMNVQRSSQTAEGNKADGESGANYRSGDRSVDAQENFHEKHSVEVGKVMKVKRKSKESRQKPVTIDVAGELSGDFLVGEVGEGEENGRIGAESSGVDDFAVDSENGEDEKEEVQDEQLHGRDHREEVQKGEHGRLNLRSQVSGEEKTDEAGEQNRGEEEKAGNLKTSGENTEHCEGFECGQEQHPFRRLPGTCWSKYESHRYFASAISKSPALVRRLREYEALHERCTSGVANWTEHYLGKVPSELADCQYLVHSCPAGLGNNIVSLISVFLYSVLTNRVLLLHWSNMRNSLCSPFPRSTWRLPWYMDSHIFGALRKHDVRLPLLMALHQDQRIKTPKNGSIPWDKPLRHNGNRVHNAVLWLSWDLTEKDEQFFCPEAQTAISRVPWIIYHSEQYAVPTFFQMAGFRKQLKILFPDRVVFPPIARYLLHPNNHMWERITRLYTMYGGRASRRVGIQVRTFADNDEFAHGRVLECAVNVSRVLPRPIPAEQWVGLMEQEDVGAGSKEGAHRIKNPQRKDVSVFLTSLRGHHYEFFREVYTDSVAEDGSLVAVFSGSHDGKEAHDIEKDRRALAEMWLLSFSDSLLTSDWSTFGYVAVGLSGLRPHLMNIANTTHLPKFWEVKRPVCSLVLTSEPCFHFPPGRLKCMLRKASYVRPCAEAKYGVQLFPMNT